METFVKTESIVREIWGDADNILFIFGAAAGEFALSKSVDWLFFTGKLPVDPIGRLFSTVVYAQQIIFAEKSKAEQTLTSMNVIHKNVENARGMAIPNWAYQDVLYMLIEYTISSFELLNRTLLLSEKEDIFEVFSNVGRKMGIEFLPEDYESWKKAREENLKTNFKKSELSKALFMAYKKHLGPFRYFILQEVQKTLLPENLRKMHFGKDQSRINIVLNIYKKAKCIWPISQLKYYLLPSKYRVSLKEIHNK